MGSALKSGTATAVDTSAAAAAAAAAAATAAAAWVALRCRSSSCNARQNGAHTRLYFTCFYILAAKQLLRIARATAFHSDVMYDNTHS